jgi:hypothetical protein
MTSTGIACGVPDGARVVGFADLLVGKSDGDGCEGVGGNAFDVAPGSVSAVATWSDPQAILKIEIWTDNFGRLLASGIPSSNQRCAFASTATDAPRIVVRVCHTAESRVPPAVRTDASTFTTYHLAVAQ